MPAQNSHDKLALLIGSDPLFAQMAEYQRSLEETRLLRMMNARLLFVNTMLRVELTVRNEELAPFVTEPARVDHPDDDWS